MGLVPEILDDLDRILDQLERHSASDTRARGAEIIQALQVLTHSPLIGHLVRAAIANSSSAAAASENSATSASDDGTRIQQRGLLQHRLRRLILLRIRPELSADADGITPNDRFRALAAA